MHGLRAYLRERLSGFYFSAVLEIIPKAEFFESQLSRGVSRPLSSPSNSRPLHQMDPSVAATTKATPLSSQSAVSQSHQQFSTPGPAVNRTPALCYHCHKPGHLSVNCRVKPQLLTC